MTWAILNLPPGGAKNLIGIDSIGPEETGDAQGTRAHELKIGALVLNSGIVWLIQALPGMAQKKKRLAMGEKEFEGPT